MSKPTYTYTTIVRRDWFGLYQRKESFSLTTTYQRHRFPTKSTVGTYHGPPTSWRIANLEKNRISRKILRGKGGEKKEKEEKTKKKKGSRFTSSSIRRQRHPREKRLHTKPIKKKTIFLFLQNNCNQHPDKLSSLWVNALDSFSLLFDALYWQ